MIQYPRYRQHRFSSFQVIIAGFAAVDLVGALLLMLPIAAQQRCVTPFHEALFTSTSALCVTGLVVQDTGSYWSAFGQSVILLLIQIGGLGVITVGAAFALLSGRKISLKQRSTMQEATAAPQMGGIVRLTGFILRITGRYRPCGMTDGPVSLSVHRRRSASQSQAMASEPWASAFRQPSVPPSELPIAPSAVSSATAVSR